MKLNNLKKNIIIYLENLEKNNNDNLIDDFTVEDIEVSIQNYGIYTTTNFVKDISVYNKDIISLLRKRIKIKLIKNGENK